MHDSSTSTPNNSTGDAGNETPLWDRLNQLWRGAGQTARLMIGVPDYQNYVEHCRRTHPDTPPMTHEAFFRSRMEARYASKTRFGCC